MRYAAGIDNGTQSTKVLIYDCEKRRVAAAASSPHRMHSRNDGTREQEAQWWIDALKACFGSFDPKMLAQVEAIGVSGQQHGFVPVDDEGEVLIPVKLWCDTSTAQQARQLTEAFGGEERLLQEAGNLMLTGYTAPKIRWFKDHHPKLYQRMRWIMLPHDYLNWVLTRRAWMECGDASGTGLISVRDRCWHDEAVRVLDSGRDLASCLPPLIESHEIGAYVCAEAAELFGIPEGIPVSSGGGDNMMSAIGSGVVTAGKLAISMGTSGTLYGYSDSPVIDEGKRLAAFCSSTGGWLPLLCTMNCTVATELYRSMLELNVKEFDALGASAPAGAQGILTLPFFNGERTPNLPRGKGCLVGMTASNVTRENISRSALESAVFGLKLGLEACEENGFQADSAVITGGGAKSPIWRQITADILGIPVTLPAYEETAALGAALQAVWAVSCAREGYVPIADVCISHDPAYDAVKHIPDASVRELYDAHYGEYKRYIEALTPLFT